MKPVCCLDGCWHRVLEGGLKKGTLGGAIRARRRAGTADSTPTAKLEGY